MERIFYSWQSDLPNAVNRGFIQSALERVARTLRDDQSLEVEPVIDRDTAGVGGAPDIASTIFSKIEESDVFVGDVSIIGKVDSRSMPNPNVLVELGFAKKALGVDRIIMVMNTAFGMPDALPFDLRMRRVVTYQMAEGASDRGSERRKLEAVLQSQLLTILRDLGSRRLSHGGVKPQSEHLRSSATYLLQLLRQLPGPGPEQQQKADYLIRNAAFPVETDLQELRRIASSVGHEAAALASTASANFAWLIKWAREIQSTSSGRGFDYGRFDWKGWVFRWTEANNALAKLANVSP